MRLLGRACLLAAYCARPVRANDGEDVRTLAKMSLAEKIGQMTQIDISLVMTDKEIDMDKLRIWLGGKRVGSILNSPYSGRDCDADGPTGLSAGEWRKVVHAVQKEAQRLGLPPVLFGLDSVHGASYVRGATLFGQQIALAATFDRELVRQVGEVTARDSIAAGVPWLFSPILDLATQPAFPRVYESFGEDPFVVSELGVAMITGIQAETGDAQLPRAAACMKHFFGYAHPANGHDRSPVYVPEAALRDYYLRPFAAAVRAGVASVMNSYNELNGVPIVASRKWLRTVLREELGFEGLLVTDWGEINNLYSFHHAALSEEAAVLLAINRTSIDMSMVPLDEGFIRHLTGLVRAGAVPLARIDESVGRVLALKRRLGLLQAPVLSEESSLIALVGTDAQLALDSARASVTLLANRGRELTALPKPKSCAPVQPQTGASEGHDVANFAQAEVPDAAECRSRCAITPRCKTWLYQGAWLTTQPNWPICFLKDGEATLRSGPDEAGNSAGTCEPTDRAPPLLPLEPATLARARVLLTGPTANSLVYQSGGWSVRWQGACRDSDFEAGGETLKGALRRLLPSETTLVHTAGCTIHAPSHSTATCDIDASDMNATLAAALASDVAVVALGEENYTEKPGDIDDLSLHTGQLELVRRIALHAPDLPIILVLISGRPRLLRGLPQLPSVLAVVHAYVPGPHGGTAIAEVLLGLTNPSGRLPLTYPALPGVLGTHYQTFAARCSGSAGGYLSGGTSDCPVEYPFGHGLSYTTFGYSKFASQPSTQVSHPGSFGVTLTVTNTGQREGRHTVLLFVTQQYRSGGVAPEVQRLVGFSSVFLSAGASAEVQFAVRTDALGFYSEEMESVVEAGEYRLFVRTGRATLELGLRVLSTSSSARGPMQVLTQAGYALFAATHANPIFMPWLAIALSVSVLSTLCFVCGMLVSACFLRQRAGTGAYVVLDKQGFHASSTHPSAGPDSNDLATRNGRGTQMNSLMMEGRDQENDLRPH
mmetsp:Transcript_10558/g.26587  ORF Transcript_10558/g.26587 Transcript_10558/m.26587 type:complete len:999 (+) Transcript_10558:243-3239(+)